ncbi:cytochrome P450 [Pholiota conissans]|uniref:Cytochrome P450 n=1 Tax=Pholiota conissans TaxID=109636 RepID=A0A9P5YUA5_9AGAR|nr:cytochrome P450 [Pholiota conissans]
MGGLPPGIRYLLQSAHKILTPPLLAWGAIRVVEAQFDVNITTIWTVLATVLSLPLALIAAVLWDELYIRFDAARKGAEMPPSIGDGSTGGFMNLRQAISAHKAGYPGDGFVDVCEKLGSYTFNRRMLFDNRIITAEPEYIKSILATQFDEFEKGAEIRYLFEPLLGTGVFAADGELWKFHRSMTRPFFSKDRISHFDNFDRHAEGAIKQLKQRLREGHPVDFQDLVARFTLDSATEFLFGNDVHSLTEGLPYPFYISPNGVAHSEKDDHPASRFVAAFSQAQSTTAYRMRFGYHWPLAEFWEDQLKKPMKIVHDFIDPIVEKAIKHKRDMEMKGAIEKDRDDETLLENLVNSTEDPIMLRDEIMSLLVAGRDTTASTLTFVVYMLAEHPKVLKRLRQEILTKIGPERRPNYDDFRDMKYLKAVLNETLRLYPVVPFNVRISKKATTWASKVPGKKPFYIPANTRTPYSVMIMHRRKDLWGPDALEFDPDRFLDERLHKYLTPNPFIFLPFNAGPRICLEQQFAYNEASFFLVRLLQNFSSFTLASEAQPPASRPPASWALDTKDSRKAREKIRPKNHLTMYVLDGLWVTMEEAKPGE